MGCKEVEKASGLKDNMPERNRAVIKEKFAKISVFEDIFFALTIDGTFYGDERQKTAILMMIDDKKTLKKPFADDFIARKTVNASKTLSTVKLKVFLCFKRKFRFAIRFFMFICFEELQERLIIGKRELFVKRQEVQFSKKL